MTVEEKRALRANVRREFQELGNVGRTTFVALCLSAVVAVALAVSIPRQVESHLLQAELDTFQRIAQDMADEGIIPPAPHDPEALAGLDVEIRTRLLGHDTVRIKLWSPDGAVVYSDATGLIGNTYPLTEDRTRAFNGETIMDTPDLALPENAFERDLPSLHELYIPVYDSTGEVVSVFEVYHLTEPIDSTVGRIRRNTLLSISIGFVMLGIFTAVLIVANGRALARRQRMTEELFGDLVRSQADERIRIIGALHDDIGQSLYRIHYGLEDMKSRAAHDGQIAEDLDRLGALVSNVDKALRAELRLLHYGTGEELALGPALDELAEVTEMESDLNVSVDVRTNRVLSPAGRVTLFRAAREAVTNTRKHADANTVTIEVDDKGPNVRLSVRDDGTGIQGSEALGLTTTRERLEALGGGLRVKPGRRGGTKFVAWLPTDLPAAEP